MTERLDALTVREHNGKSYWTKIGAAFPSKSGGWIVRLDAMPASTDGQFAIHLREPLPKDGQTNQRKEAGNNFATDPLDDDIRF